MTSRTDVSTRSKIPSIISRSSSRTSVVPVWLRARPGAGGRPGRRRDLGARRARGRPGSQRTSRLATPTIGARSRAMPRSAVVRAERHRGGARLVKAFGTISPITSIRGVRMIVAQSEAWPSSHIRSVVVATADETTWAIVTPSSRWTGPLRVLETRPCTLARPASPARPDDGAGRDWRRGTRSRRSRRTLRRRRQQEQIPSDVARLTTSLRVRGSASWAAGSSGAGRGARQPDEHLQDAIPVNRLHRDPHAVGLDALAPVRRPSEEVETQPPTVSKCSSGCGSPVTALKSPIAIFAVTRQVRSSTGCASRSSGSNSSRISPTTSSRRSSSVTRPAVPPYSSTTIAVRSFFTLNSRRSASARWTGARSRAGRECRRSDEVGRVPA